MGSSDDFLPRQAGRLEAWLGPFADGLAAHAGTLGLDPAAVAALVAQISAWQAAHRAAYQALMACRAATADQQAQRKALGKLVRRIARQIQANPATTDGIREALGLTVPDRTRTIRRGPPTTRPIAEIDAGEPLRHIIHFRNEGSENKAKPARVRACEIWRSIGVPPHSVTDGGGGGNMEFVALDTSTPHLASYAQEHAGKRVYYRLRWVGINGAYGPWSEVVEATIGG